MFASVAWGVSSASSYAYSINNFKKIQDYSKIFSMLNAQTPKDCVVLVRENTEELEKLIPAYTSCNVYSTTYVFSGITKERILHNFLINMRLGGIDLPHAHEYLLAHEGEVRTNFFSDWEQLFGHGRDQWLDKTVVYLEGEYSEFIRGNLKDELLQYRMDYLVSDAPLSQNIQNELPGLMLVKTFPGFYLYSFPK